MDVDIIGRVRNTPLSVRQGLVPLFEAISNSIDAIEDSGRADGEIKVLVKRELDSLLIDDQEQRSIAPITGFEIVDNGIGFTDINYNSFNRSDTRLKAPRGGKGIGRFLWLKAFDHVEIESTFTGNGSRFHRSFRFALDNNPISEHRLSQYADGQARATTVRLIGLKPEYAEHIIKRTDTIVYHIVEHFLEYFVLERMPEIVLLDDATDEQIDLTIIYQDWVARTDSTEYLLGEYAFVVTHFMLQAQSGMKHKLNYCAIRRVVKEKRLDHRLISNLPSRIEAADDSQLVYVGYVSSSFLDNHVNQERTDFTTFPDGGFQFVGELTWSDIETKAINSSSEYLEPYTEPVAQETQQKVEDFVAQEAPQYRSLLKRRPDIIDGIAPGITSDKLELELHQQQKTWEIELRQTADAIINSPEPPDEDDEIRQRYERFLEEWNENGKAALAKYVVHRRTTLALLEKHMELDAHRRYALEETVHKLIFPLRRTSDDIDYQQQNLWIIDEKLAFHRYLASDIPLNRIEILDSDEQDRPDLLIFDNAFAVVADEPINGVILFEFKRPMRSDSNPVAQMFRYIRKIRDGDATNNHGRPIVVRDETPFYCYAICDLTTSLRNAFDDMNLQVTPDNEGYFGYNGMHRAYVEVISFNKLLRDAKQRNKILFEQLNMPT
jgi:hypothetical protein